MPRLTKEAAADVLASIEFMRAKRDRDHAERSIAARERHEEQEIACSPAMRDIEAKAAGENTKIYSEYLEACGKLEAEYGAAKAAYEKGQQALSEKLLENRLSVAARMRSAKAAVRQAHRDKKLLEGIAYA